MIKLMSTLSKLAPSPSRFHLLLKLQRERKEENSCDASFFRGERKRRGKRCGEGMEDFFHSYGGMNNYKKLIDMFWLCHF